MNSSNRGISLNIIVFLVAILLILGISTYYIGFTNDNSSRSHSLDKHTTVDDYKTSNTYNHKTTDTPKPKSSSKRTKQPQTPTQSQEPILTVTPTDTLTRSPTQMFTPTPTNKPTETSTPDDKKTEKKYFPFIYRFLGKINSTSSVPIRLMGIQVDSGTMWVVHNGTSPFVNDTRMRLEWATFARVYAQTWIDYKEGDFNGTAPDRMRYVEFNDTQETANDSTFFVLTNDARAVWKNNITIGQFSSRWFERLRDTTEHEERMADTIAGGTANITYYPPDWNETDGNDSDTADSRPTPRTPQDLTVHPNRNAREARAVGE